MLKDFLNVVYDVAFQCMH